MNSWFHENKIGVLILILAGISVNIAYYLQMHGFILTFADTDDYMRLVRIREFFIHQDLANTVIARSNVPFGCDLHWTRFYDFFLIIPVYILNFFVNSIDKSIEYVGFIISPIIKSITIATFFCIVQQLMQKSDVFLAAALFAAHPLILAFGIFGHPDHHAFIMLFMTIYLCSVINMIKLDFHKVSCIRTSIVAAICIWISPETLIPILLSNGILFVYAFSDIEKLRLLHTKNLMIACLLVAIVFTVAGDHTAALTICMLLLVTPYITFNKTYASNRIFRYWHIAIILLMIEIFPLISPVEYDKVSVLHIALFTCAALYIGITMIYYDLNLNSRIAVSLAWLLIIGAVFLLIYPHFFKGMSANISDYAKEIWLCKVVEMRSPLSGGDRLFFIVYSIISTVSIASKVMHLIGNRKKCTVKLLWWIMVVNAICYTVFSGIAYRMLPYSMMFTLPIIVDFGMNNNFTKSLHRVLRTVITAFISMFFLFCTAFSDCTEEDKTIDATYTQEELFEIIDNLSEKPVVVMAHSNDGPSILYYTKHSVVGAPYHRQQQGIISSYKVMEDKYDEKIVKNILKETNSSYVFVRKKQYKEGKSLARMIIDNVQPKWIEIVKLPPKFNDVVVAKIVQNN